MNNKRYIVETALAGLFFYLGNKLSQSWRLAPGNGFGLKFLNLETGSARAFNNPLPGLDMADLLAGAAAVLFLFAAVTVKKMNAKKFRLGEEYGSARWSA